MMLKTRANLQPEGVLLLLQNPLNTRFSLRTHRLHLIKPPFFASRTCVVNTCRLQKTLFWWRWCATGPIRHSLPPFFFFVCFLSFPSLTTLTLLFIILFPYSWSTHTLSQPYFYEPLPTFPRWCNLTLWWEAVHVLHIPIHLLFQKIFIYRFFLFFWRILKILKKKIKNFFFLKLEILFFLEFREKSDFLNLWICDRARFE